MIYNADDLTYIDQISGSSYHIWQQHVEPGNYKLRLVTDENKNGRWDSGKLSKKKSPESTKVNEGYRCKSRLGNEFSITPSIFYSNLIQSNSIENSPDCLSTYAT